MIMRFALRKYTNVVWQKRSFQFTHFTMRQKTQKVTITLHLDRSRWKHENLFRPNFVHCNGWWDGELFGKQINLSHFYGEKIRSILMKKIFLFPSYFCHNVKVREPRTAIYTWIFSHTHTHTCVYLHNVYIPYSILITHTFMQFTLHRV